MSFITPRAEHKPPAFSLSVSWRSLLLLWHHLLFRDQVWPHSQCSVQTRTLHKWPLCHHLWILGLQVCMVPQHHLYMRPTHFPLYPTSEVTVLNVSFVCIPRGVPGVSTFPCSLWRLLWRELFFPLFHKALDPSFWFYFPVSVIHTGFVLVQSSHLCRLWGGCVPVSHASPRLPRLARRGDSFSCLPPLGNRLSHCADLLPLISLLFSEEFQSDQCIYLPRLTEFVP